MFRVFFSTASVGQEEAKTTWFGTGARSFRLWAKLVRSESKRVDTHKKLDSELNVR